MNGTTPQPAGLQLQIDALQSTVMHLQSVIQQQQAQQEMVAMSQQQSIKVLVNAVLRLAKGNNGGAEHSLFTEAEQQVLVSGLCEYRVKQIFRKV